MVWGEIFTNKKGEIDGFGLAKILEKHMDDFSDFAGDSKEKKLINGLAEIVERGKVIDENGVKTIWYKENNNYYVVGLSKGFHGKGENMWVITSYNKRDITESQKKNIDLLFT